MLPFVGPPGWRIFRVVDLWRWYCHLVIVQRYRRFVANSTMRTDIVVVLSPVFHFWTCIVKVHEPMCVQTFLPELAIELFFAAVFPRATWIDLDRLYANLSKPILKVLSNKLSAIVGTNKFGLPVFHQQPMHDPQNIIRVNFVTVQPTKFLFTKGFISIGWFATFLAWFFPNEVLKWL